MELQIGQVVYSKMGRDRGMAFIVYKVEGEYAYLTDGEFRRLARPKKKKIKHIQPTKDIYWELSREISSGAYVMDSDIVKILRERENF